MSSHDAFLCMSSELDNFATHVHIIIEYHQETMNKIKNDRAIGIGARINNLKKFNGSSIVDGKNIKCWITQDKKVTSTALNNQT